MYYLIEIDHRWNKWKNKIFLNIFKQSFSDIHPKFLVTTFLQSARIRPQKYPILDIIHSLKDKLILRVYSSLNWMVQQRRDRIFVHDYTTCLVCSRFLPLCFLRPVARFPESKVDTRCFVYIGNGLKHVTRAYKLLKIPICTWISASLFYEWNLIMSIRNNKITR